MDPVAFFVFVVCVVVYAFEFRMGMRRPISCKRGLLNVFYGSWARSMARRDDKLIAIHTARNLIMSVTFLSSAMLILLGVFLQAYNIEEVADFTSGIGENFFHLKLTTLFAVIIFSLSMFLLSLRQLVRFSILVGMEVKDLNHKCGNGCVTDGGAFLSRIFIKAMTRFTFGLRGIYYILAAMLWFISPYAFIGASVTITAMLILYQDIKAPRSGKNPL